MAKFDVHIDDNAQHVARRRDHVAIEELHRVPTHVVPRRSRLFIPTSVMLPFVAFGIGYALFVLSAGLHH